MALVGVTLIYTSDTLDQKTAENDLLDLVGDEAPEHPDCTVLKVFTFEAGVDREEAILHPEIPGPRYIINKGMAWAMIASTASTGFLMGALCLLVLMVVTSNI